MALPVDAVASNTHHVDHLAPIWLGLPEERRGSFVAPAGPARARARALGLRPRPRGDRRRLLLTASWAAVRRHGSGRRVVYVEHGAGQGYGGEPPEGSPPEDGGLPVVLALVPSERVARRIRIYHSRADVVVVGAPRLDGLPRGPLPGGTPTVAFAWHWESPLCSETRSAFPHWQSAVRSVAASNRMRWRVLGHGHPRAARGLERWYRRVGIEWVPDSLDVLRSADVLVADNTSLLYEFAAIDRPVVLLDAPWYRRDVEHGMRFWQHADMGVRVGSGQPRDLARAVAASLESDPAAVRRREVAAEVWEGGPDGAVRRAVDAILAIA